MEATCDSDNKLRLLRDRVALLTEQLAATEAALADKAQLASANNTGTDATAMAAAWYALASDARTDWQLRLPLSDDGFEQLLGAVAARAGSPVVSSPGPPDTDYVYELHDEAIPGRGILVNRADDGGVILHILPEIPVAEAETAYSLIQAWAERHGGVRPVVVTQFARGFHPAEALCDFFRWIGASPLMPLPRDLVAHYLGTRFLQLTPAPTNGTLIPYGVPRKRARAIDDGVAFLA